MSPRSRVLGPGSWVCSVPRECGITTVELLIVLSMTAILMGLAFPKWQLALDRISVRAAANDLHMTLSSARTFALASSSPVAIDFAGPGGAVRVRRNDEILFTRNIA